MMYMCTVKVCQQLTITVYELLSSAKTFSTFVVIIENVSAVYKFEVLF